MGHFDWPIIKKTFKNLPSPLPPNPHIEMTCFQIVLHEHTKPYINVIVFKPYTLTWSVSKFYHDMNPQRHTRLIYDMEGLVHYLKLLCSGRDKWIKTTSEVLGFGFRRGEVLFFILFFIVPISQGGFDGVEMYYGSNLVSTIYLSLLGDVQNFHPHLFPQWSSSMCVC